MTIFDNTPEDEDPQVEILDPNDYDGVDEEPENN